MPNINNLSFSANTISDTLSTAVIVLDKSLTIIDVNAAAENLFGQSRKRIIAKSFSFLSGSDEARRHLDFVLKHGEAHSLRGCHLKGKYDKNILVDCVANPLLYAGKLSGVVLELHRIDHQMRIVREEQLLSQQKATQILIKGLAHEIKNPLGGLRGAAQLLEAELSSDALKEYTHIIISEADRLQGLVDRMLDSHQPINNGAVNIHEVLERVRKLVRADIPEDVSLRFDYDPSIPDLIGDQDSLIQIVFNIVGNALKAVGDSGNILFKTRILRNYNINQKQHRLVMRLEVIDDGKGIPENIRDKLFYPMISGSAEGTGLGLSIAQTLANRHQGVIEFESKKNETRFILLLPIIKEEAQNNG